MLVDDVEPVYPASQLEQTADPALLKVPVVHLVQYEAPALGLYVPAKHWEHVAVAVELA